MLSASLNKTFPSFLITVILVFFYKETLNTLYLPLYGVISTVKYLCYVLFLICFVFFVVFFRVGILGEPYNLFNCMTLTPVGTETEDTEGEGECKE